VLFNLRKIKKTKGLIKQNKNQLKNQLPKTLTNSLKTIKNSKNLKTITCIQSVIAVIKLSRLYWGKSVKLESNSNHWPIKYTIIILTKINKIKVKIPSNWEAKNKQIMCNHVDSTTPKIYQLFLHRNLNNLT